MRLNSSKNLRHFTIVTSFLAFHSQLHLANQRLPPYTSLEFDPTTLQSISETLQVLEISGNQMSSLRPVTQLRQLRKLFAENNEITDIVDIEVTVALPNLEEANYAGNPCCSVRKYRDTAIGASSDSLQILDNLPILKHQQVAMRGLQAHRQKIGVQLAMRKKANEQEEALGESVADLNFFGDSIVDSFPPQQGDLGEMFEPGTSAEGMMENAEESKAMEPVTQDVSNGPTELPND